jgi:hypothetical protein
MLLSELHHRQAGQSPVRARVFVLVLVSQQQKKGGYFGPSSTPRPMIAETG